MFTMLVLMAIVSTVITVPILRMWLPRSRASMVAERDGPLASHPG